MCFIGNINNEYLEHLTHTGDTYAIIHSLNVHVCFQDSMNTHTHTNTVVYQGNGTEEKVFEKRKVFMEDLKELTEVTLSAHSFRF